MKKQLGIHTLSPCQIVAWKLQKIRSFRGLSQEKAAEMLEPYLGRRMSRAAFSHAERCLDKGRIHRFDADEIVAFARAFEVSITYFFSPAEPHRHGKPVTVNGKPGDRKARVSSLPLTVKEMTVLTQGKPSRAKLKRIAAAAAASQERAISNGVSLYLKENPERLAEVSSGKVPNEFWEERLRESETGRTAHSEDVSKEMARAALGIKAQEKVKR